MMIPRTCAAPCFIHDRAPHQPYSQLGPHHFTDVTIETAEYVDQIGSRELTKMAIAGTKHPIASLTVHHCVIEGMTRRDMLLQLRHMSVDCPRSVAGVCVHTSAAYRPRSADWLLRANGDPEDKN